MFSAWQQDVSGPGLPVHRFSEFITKEEQEAAHQLSTEIPASEIGNYKLDELAVGEHALAGALRFFARGELEGEPHAEVILRRYFNAALLTTHMTRRLLSTYPFASACFHHGIYVPQGLIGEVAREARRPRSELEPDLSKALFHL